MRAPTLPPRPLAGRVAAALASGVALAVGAALLVLPSGAAAAARGGTPEPPEGDLTMVQANIYSGLSVERFQADVREVLALEPDFITYNEVPLRNDLVMAPPSRGYAIHRKMKNRYTAAVAVAWRTDRWTEIASGTKRITNHRGKPPGRNVELGRRYANWVTLQSPLGRVVTVVAVHVAPRAKGMPDLRLRSVKRIGALVETLSAAGPVLVGGDFNLHYKGSLYPREVLTAAGMVPTYDALGSYFATGDHHGATIDYVFNRSEGQMRAADHYPVELNSDHDAVVTGFSWTVDAPAETEVITSDPAGDEVARRAAIRVLADAVRGAAPGAVVEIVTGGLDQRALARELKAALARGVHVRLTTASDDLTRRERRLARAVTAAGDPESLFRRCDAACWSGAVEAGMPPGLVMVSNKRQRWRTRIDSSRELRDAGQRATELVVRTGKFGLAEGAELLRSVS